MSLHKEETHCCLPGMLQAQQQVLRWLGNCCTCCSLLLLLLLLLLLGELWLLHSQPKGSGPPRAQAADEGLRRPARWGFCCCCCCCCCWSSR